jgi:hypothetical protein
MCFLLLFLLMEVLFLLLVLLLVFVYVNAYCVPTMVAVSSILTRFSTGDAPP